MKYFTAPDQGGMPTSPRRNKMQTSAASKNTTYWKRKAAGLCTRCPSPANPAKPGRVRCEVCTEITSDYVAGRRSIFIVRGLCERCGKKPPARGRQSCETCLKRSSARHHATKLKAA
jgi:hypothetical protein